MKAILFIILSIFLFTTCIDPAGIEPADFDDLLVVEGFITDQPGPHRIKITRMAKFTGRRTGGVISLEKNATVNIIDEEGNVVNLLKDEVTFKEIGCAMPFPNFVVRFEGFKTPASFKGEIERLYTLEIKVNGEVYRSEPQELTKTPPIEDITLAFKKIPTTNELQPRSGVNIFATWQDVAEEENYYSWRMNGIYRIHTPDRPPPPGRCLCVYDFNDGGAEDCWIHENNIEGNVIAFSDQMANGQLITKKIGFLEDDSKRFADNRVPSDKQYYLEVEQYAITKENFEFNETINTLEEIDGEIFDPPPLSIRGNIHNINNQEEIVIGYFGAYQMQKKSIFIPESLLDFKQPSHKLCGDCRRFRGAQTEIPEPYR